MADLLTEAIGEGLHRSSPGDHSGRLPDSRRVDLAIEQVRILYDEYKRTTSAISDQFDRILRIAGIGFSATGALVILIAGEQIHFGEWSYWVAPMMLILLYAVVIHLLYHMSFASYYARELEDDIAAKSNVPYFHFENTVVRGLASTRGGDQRMLAAYGLILLFACGFYIAVVGLCFARLHSGITVPGSEAQPPTTMDVPVWRQTAFVLVNSILALVLLWAASGTISSSLRDKWEKWKTLSARSSEAHARQLDQPSYLRQVAGYAVLPRKFEFFFKSIFTIGTLIVTVYIINVPISWDLFWTGLWVVICVEFLAKQATYIWNDVLDIPADQAHSYKQTTKLLSVLDDAGIGKLLFLLRTIMSFVAAFALKTAYGLDWLPWLISAIFIWQFVYDRWAKRGPKRRLFFASVGYAERAAAGTLAAMSVNGSYDVDLLLILGSWICIFMVMVLAKFWWAERWHAYRTSFLGDVASQGPSPFENRHGVWFMVHGQKYERIANYLLFVVGLALAYLYSGYPGGNEKPGTRAYHWLSKEAYESARRFWNWSSQLLELSPSLGLRDELSGSIAALIISVALVALGMGTAYRLRRSMRQDSQIRWILGLVGAMVLIFLLSPDSLRLYSLVFFLPLIGVVNYEGLTMEDLITLDDFLRSLPKNTILVIDWVLFKPWAVRVCIRAMPTSMVKTSGNWPVSLQTMYEGWANSNGLRVYRINDAGPYPFDLVMQGGPSKISLLALLRGERGIHLRSKQVKEGSVDGYAPVETALVEVVPLSVAFQTSVGNSFDIPDFAERDDSAWSERHALVRTYAFDNCNKCVDVCDVRLGCRSDDPEGIMVGKLDKMLSTPISA